MKRILAVLLLVVIGLQAVEPAFASRVRVRRGPYPRTTVVVHQSWPLRRPARVVYVRPARSVVRVHSSVFLPSVVFVGTVVTTSSVRSRPAIVWEDSEVLYREDGWSEVLLNADSRGSRLWLEIPRGRVQFDWAEVVFENGDARVVDFRERTHGPGLYPLLDFHDGRRVDHVRLVARAKSYETKIVLRMER